ncbi:MAG TPA: hypothetical protein VFZ09_39540 [Archangium sp.]|uniref:hypothetical protein n=1 Tax=Archangium sp. TaxID=1872627 RepID=UPI002E345681|nr:hypothetical protein [Archangium sp.]HEX5752366.1 hypothetical protein [Archangium sp.]
MLLDHYIASCLGNAQYYTQSELKVGSVLADKIRGRIQLSEANVQELGFNLFWLSSKLWAGQFLQGSASGTTISLDTTNARQKPGYIGDFHTHPYEKKMGGGAKLPFSNGDLVEYFDKPPLHQPISLHFVASSDQLYLIVFRGTPPAEPDFTVTTPEVVRLNEHMMNNDKLSTAYMKADSLTGMAKWAAMKKAWENHAPQAAAEFAEDTLRMNLDLANHHGYEFYMGSLAGTGEVTLTLQSRYVYCSTVTRVFSTMGEAYEAQRRAGPITLM